MSRQNCGWMKGTSSVCSCSWIASSCEMKEKSSAWMQTCRINAFARSFISRVCGFGGTLRMKRPIRASETSALGLYNQTSIQWEHIASSCVVLLITCIASKSRKKLCQPVAGPCAARGALSLSALLGSHTQKLFSRLTDRLTHSHLYVSSMRVLYRLFQFFEKRRLL